jgi:hypothetical protein
MKIYQFYYIVLIAFCVTVVSCKKDNFEEPTSLLKGRIVYQGEAIGVERDQVPFELYQYGFGKVGPIASSFAPMAVSQPFFLTGNINLLFQTGRVHLCGNKLRLELLTH